MYKGLTNFRRIYRPLFFIGLCMISVRVTFAQPCHLKVSLLTCGTGEDLYASFGHSAVRVVDSVHGGDFVFNYGTFDFDKPDFYWQFTRGKLLYYVSMQDFPSFMMEYRYEKRKVVEQVLNLNCSEKEAVWQFLQNNALPENRNYKYDFLFDNCSTRIRDIFSKIFQTAWKVPDIVPGEHLSFRDMINDYLKNKPWERLGINLLFGKRTDAAVDSWHAMFLPDYLMKGIGHSAVGTKPLVKETILAYDPGPVTATGYPFYKHPLFWFSLLAVLVIVLSLNSGHRISMVLLPWVDRCLFFLTGLLGIFMLFMWFGTDHRVCAWNFNLLWAFPLNILFSFYSHRRSGGVQRYAVLTILLNLIVLAGWFELPQQLPLEVIPLVAMLTIRAWGIFSRNRSTLGR